MATTASDPLRGVADAVGVPLSTGVASWVGVEIGGVSVGVGFAAGELHAAGSASTTRTSANQSPRKGRPFTGLPSVTSRRTRGFPAAGRDPDCRDNSDGLVGHRANLVSSVRLWRALPMIHRYAVSGRVQSRLASVGGRVATVGRQPLNGAAGHSVAASGELLARWRTVWRARARGPGASGGHVARPGSAGSHEKREALDVPVTVAICSRERPAQLERAVEAAVDVMPAGNVSLLVVDQSAQPQAAMASLHERGHLRYVHDPDRGASRARNRALIEAQTPYVVFTDDDCELQPGAVVALVEALRRQPDAVLAYGNVVACRYVTSEGFVPSADVGGARSLSGRLAKRHDRGIGACRAVRRESVLALGGFDERFGPGSLFGAAEDGELAYRVLSSGSSIALEPAARVVHHGRVSWASGRRYGRRVSRSLGAIYGVHASSGDLMAPLMLAAEAGRVLRMAFADMGRGGRPRGVGQLLGLASGFAAGMRSGRRLWFADGSR